MSTDLALMPYLRLRAFQINITKLKNEAIFISLIHFIEFNFS